MHIPLQPSKTSKADIQSLLAIQSDFDTSVYFMLTY